MALRYDDWLLGLRDVAARLSSRDIDVELEIGDPAPQDEIERLEAQVAQIIGKSRVTVLVPLIAMGTVAHHIQFSWQTPRVPEARPMFGRMALTPISTLAAVVREPDAWHTFDESGALTQVLLRVESGSAALARRSIEGGEESIAPLDLTIDEYFQLSLATCCLSNWPLLFAADRDLLTPEDVEEFLASLQDVSPPGDPDAVRRRRGVP